MYVRLSTLIDTEINFIVCVLCTYILPTNDDDDEIEFIIHPFARDL